jgi:hypothetical protein
MRRFDLPKDTPKRQPSPQYRRISAAEQQQLNASRQMFDGFLGQATEDKSQQ